MTLVDSVLAINNDLPIRTKQPIHNGKVRSVYWLTAADSQRLIQKKNYSVPKNTPLAVMVISDRISAFDCIFEGENGLKGIPGKGAALNAIANHWFKLFKQQGLADNHILDMPHPLVWIVQKATPIKIEGIIRQYITGSMWRAYQGGERNFCGIKLKNGLTANQKLAFPLITPSTKGIIKGIANIPEQDDTNISKQDLKDNYQTFGFESVKDIELYEKLLLEGFNLISQQLDKIEQIFVDTKFEFGYVKDKNGKSKLIYMDEVGTPDSSRIWDKSAYQTGKIIENSKEDFRQMLLNHFPKPDILLNKDRMAERIELAKNSLLPLSVMLSTSKTYLAIAKQITGKDIVVSKNPKQEIIDILNHQYQLIDF